VLIRNPYHLTSFGSAFNPSTVQNYVFHLRPRGQSSESSEKKLRRRAVDPEGGNNKEEDDENESGNEAEMQVELARLKLQAGEAVLGKLRLSWHSAFGETGMRRILVKHKPRPAQEVEVSIAHIHESTITLETPFTVTVKVTNKLSRPLLPWVQLAQEEMVNIVATGLSAGFKMEEIPAGGSSRTAEVAFLPLAAGIQVITGISVLDKKTARTYTCPDQEVLVLHPTSLLPKKEK